MAKLFAVKPLKTLLHEAEDQGSGGLKRALGPVNLITLGIGAIIGAGIFVLTGTAAAQFAGPAIVLSFVVAGIGCVFAGLCYAEFASMIPIAGSAYTYGYATLGELVAWIIGWALVLEYAFGAATVAVGWSGYVSSLLGYFGIRMPFNPTPSVTLTLFGHLLSARVDIFAMCAIVVVTAVLVVGVRESANFNSAAVMIKVSVVLFFIGIATVYAFAHPAHMMANWHPFIPKNLGHFGQYGWSGIMRGASVVFFAYIGFDAVSTAAQEAKNPQKDMPFGILGSLVICTILYIIVAALLTGLKPYTTLNTPAPVADGAAAIGATWGVMPDRSGRDCRAGFGDAGDDARPVARALHDVARRPAAELGGPDSSALPHSLAGDDRSRRDGSVSGGVLPHLVPGRAGEPGNAAGLHHCVSGGVGDAQAAARDARGRSARRGCRSCPSWAYSSRCL